MSLRMDVDEGGSRPMWDSARFFFPSTFLVVLLIKTTPLRSLLSSAKRWPCTIVAAALFASDIGVLQTLILLADTLQLLLSSPFVDARDFHIVRESN